MVMGAFLFKQKAKEALRGKWQNALVVCFFSGLFLTVASLLQTKMFEGLMAAASSLSAMMSTVGGEMTNAQMMQLVDLANRYMDEFYKITPAAWGSLGGAYLAALVFGPALKVGCARYFALLVRGTDIGVKDGLLGRFNILFKSMWLYVRMGVQIALWGLLFIIPGVIAAIRYSMAPYLLADDPSLSASEAIQKSKEMMKGRKASYFMLMISFIGWSLVISFGLTLLGGVVGRVVLDVVAQFAQVALNTYIAASSAAFYNAFVRENGVEDLVDFMRRRMREAGMSENDISAAGFGGGEDMILEDEEEADDGTVNEDDADGGEGE